MSNRIINTMLCNYKGNLAQIKNMKLECEEYDILKAISYNEGIQKGNDFYSSVENAVIGMDGKKKDLLKRIKNKENEISKIDNAIEVLNEREKYLIEKYYFEGIPIKIISINMGLDQTYVSALKGKILKKMQNLIFF